MRCWNCGGTSDRWCGVEEGSDGPPFFHVRDKEQFVTDPVEGFQLELRGVRQTFGASAFGNGRRERAAKDFRTDGEVKFINESGLEQGRVEFAATFAQQAAHVPLLAQVSEGAGEVDLFATANEHLIRERMKKSEL